MPVSSALAVSEPFSAPGFMMIRRGLLGVSAALLVAPLRVSRLRRCRHRGHEVECSATGQLGRFKKGPFRMAMTAGVPIVPIVIRNADLVTSREAGLIRPGTIEVTVLPPVATSDWKVKDLDDRIAEVRQQYVDTLANWPESTSAQAGTSE